MPHVKRITGIYCFENKINGKKYIGQASNMERRLYEHDYYLARGRDKCAALQRAVSKYGRDNFDVYVLEECSVGELNEKEMYYIEKYKTNTRNGGYNLSSGGDSGMNGYVWPPEFGRRISEAKKGRKMPDGFGEKISRLQKGKIVSEETKRKMSENSSRFWSGKKMPTEMIEKLKISHGGANAWQLGKKEENATSKYYGVYRMIQKGHVYWGVKVNNLGNRQYIGMRKDELEAALLYDSYVKEHNLPNPLNFSEESK